MLLTEDMSMSKLNWKKEIFTIPNLLSLFRLILIPVYINIYLNAESIRDYQIAGLILAASCTTDMIDGKIARHFNMITTVGKVLDPLADKLTQLSVTICLAMRYQVLRPVLILFLVKEIFQLVAAIMNYRRGKALDGALMVGKVCTTVLFISLILLVLFPNIPIDVVDAIAIIDCSFLAVTFVDYIRAFFGKNAKVQDIEK